MTKEIHKLVAASRAFERDPDRNPFARDGRTGTEWVYWQALSRRWNDQGDTDRVHLRVVVDIVAGTSAGGINGIFLAKALTDGGSQDRLRDLRLTQGDIARLVRGPRWIPWQLRVGAWVSGLSRRGTLLGGTSTPLRGDGMSRQLYAALQTMSAAPAADGSLVMAVSDLEQFSPVRVGCPRGWCRGWCRGCAADRGDESSVVGPRAGHVIERVFA